MQRIVMATLSVAFLFISFGSSGTDACTKFWHYGSTEVAAWKDMGADQWGGWNSWCNKSGTGCSRYDWMAIYPGECSALPTPSWTNTATYGDSLVHAAAVDLGVSLPSNLGTPTYSTFE